MKVVVIGAGIVGVTAALTLAEDGVDVTVLDRGPVAGEASGLNAGIIGGGGWGDHPDIEVALKMGSRERYVDLSHERGHDIGLDLTGTLSLIQTAEEWDWAVTHVAADRTAGRVLELLDQAELLAAEPSVSPHLLGAILDPLSARAEPVAATLAFAAEARSAGAGIRTDVAVAGLQAVNGGGWEVHTEMQTNPLGADAVIIAAGPWCAPIGAMVGVDIPIVGVRGQMWASAPHPSALRHAISAVESPLAWADERVEPGTPPQLTHRNGTRVTRHLYGRQRPNGEIVFGGDRVITTDRGVDVDGIETNHAHTAELLPFVGPLNRSRSWSGQMPFSLDGAPLIGPVPGHTGLFLAGGLASSGFGRGPMAGQLVAELAAGHTPYVDLADVALDGRVSPSD